MRHDLTGKPPLSRTDKLCLLAIAGIMVLTAVVYELTDGRAIRAAEVESDKPPSITVTVPAIDVTPLVEAVEVRREELYWEAVPLDETCQAALWEACEANGVPVCLALGLIETESGFSLTADNGLCYGLMQLNKRYYPADLSPSDNIQAGVAYLGELLEKYDGDTQAALRAYNRGWDDGDRAYPKRVLSASEKWGMDDDKRESTRDRRKEV